MNLIPYQHTYEYMVKQPTLDKVIASYYFEENFLKRYLADIPLFAHEVCSTTPTHQQVDVCEAHDPYGGRLAVPSGHSCGKTKLIGILSVHHMVTAIKSITRIVAPKREQITKLSFGEVVETVERMARHPHWGFLAKFFKFTKTLIYIKGFETSWYIEAVVARIGNSDSLAGQHNWSYLLILDEAIGINDDNIKVSLGGLTEDKNSCIAFSQHAHTTPIFHHFVTTLSVEHGGVWKVCRLSSLQSPRLTNKQIDNMLGTYTADEIRVRIKGLFPLNTSGKLFSLEDTELAYTLKEWVDSIEFSTRTYTVDIAYKGIRDSSVIVKSDVVVYEDNLGIQKYFVVITDIDVYNRDTTKLRPTEVAKKSVSEQAKEIDDNGYIYSQYFNAIDASSGGFEASLVLEDEARSSEEPIETFALEWGGKDSLSNADVRKYTNERAKGFIELQKTVSEDRFFIKTEAYKGRVLREMGILEILRDTGFRYQIISKKDLKLSPDILDCFAEIFLLSYETSKKEEVKEDNYLELE